MSLDIGARLSFFEIGRFPIVHHIIIMISRTMFFSKVDLVVNAENFVLGPGAPALPNVYKIRTTSFCITGRGFGCVYYRQNHYSRNFGWVTGLLGKIDVPMCLSAEYDYDQASQ